MQILLRMCLVRKYSNSWVDQWNVCTGGGDDDRLYVFHQICDDDYLKRVLCNYLVKGLSIFKFRFPSHITIMILSPAKS